MRVNLTLLGVSAGLTAVCLSSAASPQSESTSSTVVQPSIHALVEDWRADHGPSWRVATDRETGYANFLYGGSSQAKSVARTDADYFQLARDSFSEAQGFFGVEQQTMLEDRVMLLPLGLAGSTDKISVQFNQAVNGVPVRRGFVNALFHVGGELLALDTTGLPNVADFNVMPSVTPEQAVEVAVAAFASETGMFATFASEPVLAIERDRSDKLVEAALIWELRVIHQLPETMPEGYVYLIAAQGTPRVLVREEGIHNFDVGGTVTTNATPGRLPDTGANPAVPFPAAHMRVTSGANTTTTDVNGNFNFPGLNGPVDVTFRYIGPFNDVRNQSGAELSDTRSLSGTGNSILVNATPTEAQTAQANAFHRINLMRDWTRGINPADSSMDAVNRANVMLSSTCNAFYDGSSTNYFRAGGGCQNSGYSTIIYHEQGHWLNDRYGSGNGSDGFGEGNSDVFAMFQIDYHLIGEGFGFSPRSGLNTRQWCGSGCYGQVHNDGEVWMGAAWKVRRNLKNSHPNGGDITDLLFNSWMNGFNQGSIGPIIETQWLTLDDDDGNIDNGTPNYADIDAGFKEQGFPGFALTFVNFANRIEPVDSLDDIGPFGVAADLSAVLGTSITNSVLAFSVDGGAFSFVNMANVTGTTWAATIPGTPSPAKISWYIVATDDLGNAGHYPKNAPTAVNAFRIGEVNSFFFDDFETAGNDGWSHGLIANQDDWQKGTPTGASGDATSAFSGTRVWGNDLAPAGWNGAYQANTHNWLRSPSINLSAATGTMLSFQRWLTVEEGIFDQATVRVNGTTVWANPLNGNLADTAWTELEIDVSAVADGVANTTVEFHLESDGGLEFGGWNIDDLEFLSFTASPLACLPTNYGTGLAGSGGVVPTIDSGKQPTRIGNADHSIKVKNGPPLATAIIGIGQSSVNFSIFGGTLLVVPEILQPVTLDVFGQFEFAAPLANNPGTVGQDFYLQAFIFDPGAPMGISMTDGLNATICN